MVVLEELHLAISEVTKHSKSHVTGFVWKKAKNGRQKRKTNAPSPLSQEMLFPLKNWDILPKPETTPLETKAGV